MLVMNLHKPGTYISIFVSVAAAGIPFLTFEGIILKKTVWGTVSMEFQVGSSQACCVCVAAINKSVGSRL